MAGSFGTCNHHQRQWSVKWNRVAVEECITYEYTNDAADINISLRDRRSTTPGAGAVLLYYYYSIITTSIADFLLG